MSLEDIKKLPIPERLDLLEKVWASLSDTPDAPPLTAAQREEIGRRVEQLERSPDSVESADQVKAFVRDPKRQK